MFQVVKYTSVVPVGEGECSQKLEGCDAKSGLVHVCFEDGSGTNICRNCFNSLIDQGSWVTDSTIRLAS